MRPYIAKRLHDGLRDVLRGDERRRRCRARRAPRRSPGRWRRRGRRRRRARPGPRSAQVLEEQLDGVGAGEDGPGVGAGARALRAPRPTAASSYEGSISMAGSSTGIAPSSASSRARALACRRVRVMSTRLPNSGRSSNQRSVSRRRTTSPTTVIAGGSSPASAHAPHDVGEGAGDGALLGRRAPADDGGGRLGGPAVARSASRRSRAGLHAHQEDERVDGGGQAAPSRSPVSALSGSSWPVTTAKLDGDAAVGDGDAGVGGHGDGGGDAGHDLEGDAGVAQRLRLLAAAAEDERVAALQPDDALALAGLLDEQGVDRVLVVAAGRAGDLADVDQLGVRRARAPAAAG